MRKTIVWFRKDLRMHDNPALWEAAQQGIVIPVFILPDEEDSVEVASEVGQWWLHHSLTALKEKLESHGLSLVILRGDCLKELTSVCNETQADAVFFSERFEPQVIERDKAITLSLLSKGIEVRSFSSNLLYPPYDIMNQKNEPYKVFTSYWKRTMLEMVSPPLPIPIDFAPLDQILSSLKVEELNLLSDVGWDEKFSKYWTPGEKGAITRWQQFTDDGLSGYTEGRDVPSANAVSLLSPHFAWGEISVRAVWQAANVLSEVEANMQSAVDAFLRQIVWREFAYHQLIHFPKMLNEPLRENFEAFPWLENDEAFSKWKKGLTGYPLVDAGMRELWETGAIHNRVRMVVASFLVKHLLITWVDGADWFAETLVDYDAASNAMGWQWVAGSGIDAAPYFRIFNPILQSQRFDPNGFYIKKWIPELAKLPSKYIHEPWKAPEDVLSNSELTLGQEYPLPMIDHPFARKRALEAYAQIKNKI